MSNVRDIEKIIDEAHVGMLKGKFANEEEINKLEPVTISEVFAILKKEVDEYYA